MNCYFSRGYKDLNNAGRSTRADIEDILESNGFVNIGAKRRIIKSKIKLFLYDLYSIIKSCIKLRRGDVLYIQYPIHKYYSLLCTVAHIKGAKSVTHIHDLGAFRRKRITAQHENKTLSKSSAIIAHNETMKRWLIENGCKRPIICIGIFDFLSSTTNLCNRDLSERSSRSIMYAGALSIRKNSFLYDFGEHIHNYSVNLYGNGFDQTKAKCVTRFNYKGFVQSNILVERGEGDFGLVWDGDSIDLCSGNWGEYLRYNNPLKTALYIRCEIPIITWKEAAISTFILENGIGLCVDSLRDIDSLISNITQSEYDSMKQNVKLLSTRIANGYYTMRAFNEAIKQI